MDESNLLKPFYELDKDKTGVVTKKELKSYMEEKNYDKEFIEVSFHPKIMR